MSAEAINIAVAQSSVAKGESLKDTLLTLQALKADCIVMRHPVSGAAEFAAQKLNIPIVNAGDGRHPLSRIFKKFSGWRIAIRGRWHAGYEKEVLFRICLRSLILALLQLCDKHGTLLTSIACMI